MIDLHDWSTPNGCKISIAIALEEMGDGMDAAARAVLFYRRARCGA